jgi:O-acetyl-ADP-ribose deacetylase (regulator of RNase III)
MIKWAEGNPFDQEFDIRVNTVNCVGVMGKGIALEFKKRYPRMHYAYTQLCRGGVLKPGNLHIWCKPQEGEWIINFVTKNHWRNPSRYEWIQEGLLALHRYLKPYGLQTVSLPALGCGNGGLDWGEVKPMIVDALSDLDAVVYVYPPESSR